MHYGTSFHGVVIAATTGFIGVMSWVTWLSLASGNITATEHPTIFHHQEFIVGAFVASVSAALFLTWFLVRISKRRDRLAAELYRDLDLAARVQRSFLPGDLSTDFFELKTVYLPFRTVSGDSFGYRWNAKSKLLCGYIMDVTGHGMAPALQTAALHTIMERLMAQPDHDPDACLRELNAAATPYLRDDSFVAVLFFLYNGTQKTISFATGGINHLWTIIDRQTGWMQIPGMYVGISDCPEFGRATYSSQTDDTFVLATDGFTDIMRVQPAEQLASIATSALPAELLSLDNHPARRDDCAALYIRFK